MSLGKEELAALLKYHDDLYYNQDNPQLSDIEYDALKNQYVELYGEYNYVPGEASADSIKFEHPVKVTSLDKVQITEVDKLTAHLKRLWPVIIQPKMDGLTLVSYADKDVTRGNGSIGEVVTSKTTNIEGIGKRLGTTVRSEVVMLKQYLEPINKKRIAEGKEPFKNLRNAAAGMLRNKDVSKVEGLRAYAYNFVRDEEINDAENQILSLRSWGWNTVSYFKPSTIEEAIKYITTYDEKYRDDLEYEIDGLVIKHDGSKTFGETGHHPNNAVAVKFKAKGAWTPIKSITWQVGKESITPVAELEPIEIDGSIISRATLHNGSFLKAIGLDKIYTFGKTTMVKVVKANDVIPRIIEVKHEQNRTPSSPIRGIGFSVVTYPDKCPVCGANTAIKESDSDSEILICTGANCKAKLQARILQMCSRDGLNIVGMSEGTIKKFLDTYDIEKPSDILNATYEDILDLEGFAEKSAKKLYDSIQNAIKEQPINKILYASAIPLIGKSAAKDICEHFSIEEIALIFSISKKKAIELLLEVKDIGETTAKSLIANKEIVRELYKHITKSTDIKYNKSKINNQLTFCITGQREPFKTIIESAGHKVSSSISKKTSALINANNETSSKATKAKDLGIPVIITEEELRKFLQEN